MSQRKALAEILRLDPIEDHLRIVYLDVCHEFPFDITRSDEFAIFRAFAVPTIAKLLAQTGEFEHHTQKRYDDTTLILCEIQEHGYDSERGRAALRRLNQIHGRFKIANDDFLYILSTFVFEPPRWMAKYAYRPMVEAEKLALFHFWREVGRRMNIHDVPPTPAEFEAFNLAYEREHFRYTEASQRVATATRDMFLGWFLPGPLKPLGAPAIYAIMDDPMLEACGFPKPPAWLRRFVQWALRLRGRLAGWLPERRRPYLHTAQRLRSYPHGYRIEELGPTG